MSVFGTLFNNISIQRADGSFIKVPLAYGQRQKFIARLQQQAGLGLDGNAHAASLSKGVPGILHGNRTYLLQDTEGQIREGHSISAGLDYPGIGPEHSWLNDQGRVNYVSSTDDEALNAFEICSKYEGIIPALEPSHALAFVFKLAKDMRKDQIIIVNLCGRGDKDIETVADYLGVEV